MKDAIYYYKTISGTFHFSSGVVKPEDKAGQYLRMLRYANYPVEQLHLDNPEDYNVICNLFNIHGKTWQDIYNESL